MPSPTVPSFNFQPRHLSSLPSFLHFSFIIIPLHRRQRTGNLELARTFDTLQPSRAFHISFLVPHIFFFFLLLLFSHCRPPSSPSFVISSFVFALRHLVLAYFPPSFRFQAVLFLFLSSSLGFHIISPSPPPPLCPPWPIILTPTHSSDTRLPYTGCPFVFRLNCV